jgi:uncharacterized protein (DUF885 family)
MKANLMLTLCAVLPALVLPLGSCSRGPAADEQFVALANRCLDGMLERDPEWATGLGDHRFDRRLTDRTLEGIQERIAWRQSYLDSLAGIEAKKLSAVNKIDYEILRNHLEADLFEMRELRPHERDPLYYNTGGAIYNLVARDFAPLRERLLAVKQRLEAVPATVAAAKANLENPPRIFTETAIVQNTGVINLIMDELQPFLEQEDDLSEEFVKPRARAIAALQDYGQWLETELLPRSTGDFRLGEANYRLKLRYTLESDLTQEEILAAAEQDLRDTEQAMYETAQPLYERYFSGSGRDNQPSPKEVIRAVLDRLAEDHPDNGNIVARAREDLVEATEFVREHDLVAVPDEPIQLIVMPEYQRGVAIAYCDAPGPLEENRETFYSIAPTPRDWSPAKVESFFREYNDYMLQNLTIHEAMPGHYLQLAHANAFSAPTPIRSVFGSGTFIEGWATYSEQLMAEAGYGGPEVKMQQLKMRLRLIINAILDPKIHTELMTEREAMDLMMNAGFQEEGEAAGKWRRACLTSTQLSTYYVGNVEVNRIRRDYEAKTGDKFNLRSFHDRLLSFGSPAPKYVRRLMGL